MTEKEGKGSRAKPEMVAKGLQDSIKSVKTLPKGNKLYEAEKRGKAGKD